MREATEVIQSAAPPLNPTRIIKRHLRWHARRALTARRLTLIFRALRAMIDGLTPEQGQRRYQRAVRRKGRYPFKRAHA